jgi:hypothetical protein
MTTYTTGRYDRLLAHVRQRFPHSEILSPRELFTDNADWRARWPSILPTLAVLVFGADARGWIGRGVYREVLDARAAGIQIVHLTVRGALIPCEQTSFTEFTPTDPRRYARVRVQRLRAREVA